MTNLPSTQFKIQKILLGLDENQLRHIAYKASEIAVQEVFLETDVTHLENSK